MSKVLVKHVQQPGELTDGRQRVGQPSVPTLVICVRGGHFLGVCFGSPRCWSSHTFCRFCSSSLSLAAPWEQGEDTGHTCWVIGHMWGSWVTRVGVMGHTRRGHGSHMTGSWVTHARVMGHTCRGHGLHCVLWLCSKVVLSCNIVKLSFVPF